MVACHTGSNGSPTRKDFLILLPTGDEAVQRIKLKPINGAHIIAFNADPYLILNGYKPKIKALSGTARIGLKRRNPGT